MNFRMKSKHWAAKGLTRENYDPALWVRPGSQAWQMRVAVNELYNAGRTAEYEVAKSDLLKILNKDAERRKKNGPIMLSLELKHGDMVVMHGEEIQRVHEVIISLSVYLSSNRLFDKANTLFSIA